MVGRAMGEGSNEYALFTDNAFFEFLQPGGDEPVMAADVVPGCSYEVVLTNAAGLYRYRLGDVVRIERRESKGTMYVMCVLDDVITEISKAPVAGAAQGA